MARILLADDDPSLLDVLGMAFGDAGYDVVTATDGAEALAVAKREAPAISRSTSSDSKPRIAGARSR